MFLLTIYFSSNFIIGAGLQVHLLCLLSAIIFSVAHLFGFIWSPHSSIALRNLSICLCIAKGDEAYNTMLSANAIFVILLLLSVMHLYLFRPLLQCSMTALNSKGDRGSPCLTPHIMSMIRIRFIILFYMCSAIYVYVFYLFK